MSASLVGALLGATYRLVRVIGEGGMGTVYEAEHTRLPRRFAVKVLGADLVGRREVFERFRREAEIASSLGCEHIAAAIDFNYADDGSPYIVLELLEGESLAERLARGRLPLAATVTIVEQIAEALEAAHARGVVHRDLKPANVFLARRGAPGPGAPARPPGAPAGSPAGAETVKVLDFGVSKILHAATMATSASVVLGTPSYMSPEQASAQHDRIDARTDVFALGAIAYECLTGRRAFSGPTPVAIMYEVVSGAPVPLRELAPELPPEVERVVARALAKAPEDRFPGAAALAAALRAAAVGLADTLAASRAAARSPGPITAATRRRWRWGLAAGVLLGGAVAVGLAFAIGATGRRGPGAEGRPHAERVPHRRDAALTERSHSDRQVAAALEPTRLSPSPPAGASRPALGALATAGKPAATLPPGAAPAGAQASAIGDFVNVRLRVDPPTARVAVEGVPTTDNPIRLARADRRVRVTLSASGYRTETHEVLARTDGELSVRLARQRALTRRAPAGPTIQGPLIEEP